MTQKAIIINAYPRGGSGILWNLLQSHPDVCSPILETGEVIQSLVPIRRRYVLYALFGAPWRKQLVLNSPLGSLLGDLLHTTMEQRKMTTLAHPDNRTRFEGVLYTHAQLAHTTLVSKSLNQDILLNDLFATTYADCRFVGLVRNGYALCEGWMRRGWSAERSGRRYAHFGRLMIEASQRHPHYRFARFEDILAEPIKETFALYEWLGLEPAQLDKLRLRSMRRRTTDGDWRTPEGHQVPEGSKVWLTHDEVREFLSTNTTHTQIKALSDHDRRQFERYAMPTLEHFGYV